MVFFLKLSKVKKKKKKGEQKTTLSKIFSFSYLAECLDRSDEGGEVDQEHQGDGQEEPDELGQDVFEAEWRAHTQLHENIDRSFFFFPCWTHQ